MNINRKIAASVAERTVANPRNYRKGGKRQAVLTNTGMWELLIWAYKTECVRAALAGGHHGEGRSCTSAGLEMMAALGVMVQTSGASDFAPNVHADAIIVFDLVEGLGDSGMHDVVIETAEAGKPPQIGVQLPKIQVLPDIKQGRYGPKPRIIYDSNRNPFACPIVFTGVSVEKQAAFRAKERKRHDLWREALRRLHVEVIRHSSKLTRWRVTGIGTI